MKKSVIKILFTLGFLAMVLAACGSEDSGAKSDGGGDTIKIGVNLELSGGVASYGQSDTEGIELAVEEINKAGGIDGKQIEVIKVDNKSEAAEATNVALN